MLDSESVTPQQNLWSVLSRVTHSVFGRVHEVELKGLQCGGCKGACLMAGASKASKSPTGLLSFEPNSLLQAADVQIASLEYSRATKEAPWDGKALQHFWPSRTCR